MNRTCYLLLSEDFLKVDLILKTQFVLDQENLNGQISEWSLVTYQQCLLLVLNINKSILSDFLIR